MYFNTLFILFHLLFKQYHLFKIMCIHFFFFYIFNCIFCPFTEVDHSALKRLIHEPKGSAYLSLCNNNLYNETNRNMFLCRPAALDRKPAELSTLSDGYQIRIWDTKRTSFILHTFSLSQIHRWRFWTLFNAHCELYSILNIFIHCTYMLEGNWVPFLVKSKVKSEQMFLTEYDIPLPAIIF